MSAASSSSSHPAMRGFGEVIPLSGFSGAVVALVRSRTGAQFVRKASSGVDSNKTLERQADRQRILASTVAECASVPEIYDEGYIDGTYYFDMAFVPSRDAVNYLSNCPFDGVVAFSDRIERMMGLLARSSPVTQSTALVVRDTLVEKLEQIDCRTNGRYRTELARLRIAAETSPSLMGSTQTSACHGDLTFENILVDRKGTLWLIDSIDSPIEHYWLDWSKLFQECEGRWHAHRGRDIATGVTWWLRNRLLEIARRLDPAYPANHYLLLGLTFARILPYARSDEDRSFIGRRVADFAGAAIDALQRDST